MSEFIYDDPRRGPWYSHVPAPKKKISHIGHKKHLCNLVWSEDCSLDEIKLLVKDAKFICRVCGRAAVEEENLCEPKPFEQKMDKWKGMMQKSMAMPKEEQMIMMKKSTNMCICKDCPSYKSTRETGLLFCGIGKSSIIKEEKGCTCGTCPVVSHMGLTRLYYCTRGNEKEQRSI